MSLTMNFIVFLLFSWVVLLLLFVIGARRKRYFHFVPFILVFALVTGVLLVFLQLQPFFWWYLVSSAVFLLVGLMVYLTSGQATEAFAGLEKTVLESIADDQIKERVKHEMSPRAQALQHVAGSVLAFVLALCLAYYLADLVI